MQQFFKGSERPDQNDLVIAHFVDQTGPELGKYQNGKLVRTSGKGARDWSDVAQWRRSEVSDPAPLVTPNKAAS